MVQRAVEAVDPLERDASGPRSLMRVLGVLDHLSRTPHGMGLSELATVLNTPKSSLLNLVRPMVAEGFLSHVDGTYRLGTGAFRLCAGVMSVWNFPKLVRQFMEELAERTNETVLLGVMNRDAGVLTYVEIIDSPNPIRYQIEAGTTRPLYASSAGRLLLAYSDPTWVDDYIATLTIKTRTATPISKAWLRKTLVQIKREGVSWSINHYMDGLASVVAPVLDGNGECLASLGIAGPSNRFQSDLGRLIDVVKEVSARASGMVDLGSLSFQPRE